MAPETPTEPAVDVSADGLRVTVRLDVIQEPVESAAQSIASQLLDLGVCEQARQLDLCTLLRQWQTNDGERVSQVLFEGTPPGPAQDGRLEWARDFFVTGFELDSDRDTVDYRRRLDERSVSKDELLCTITDPIDGTPGVDVFGRTIRGPKAKRPRIKIGPNVATPDGRRYYATCDGRIRWQRGVLSVDDVYVVEGSVNLRTGNIRHPGTLVVYGDVERGSVVVADKDVDVRGTIDGGSVHAGGDVTVQGGIVGHGTSSVNAGGTIRAAYLLDARVEAGADLFVGREIVQSRASARGVVNVSQGRIVGGIVSAGISISAGEVGTDAAVKTALHVDEPQQSAQRRRELEQRLDELGKQHEQLGGVVIKLRQAAGSLPPEKRAVLEKLSAQLQNVADERDECGTELDELSARLPAAETRSVRILRRLHAETLIGINGETKKIAHTIDGPVTVHNRNDEIRVFAD